MMDRGTVQESFSASGPQVLSAVSVDDFPIGELDYLVEDEDEPLGSLPHTGVEGIDGVIGRSMMLIGLLGIMGLFHGYFAIPQCVFWRIFVLTRPSLRCMIRLD